MQRRVDRIWRELQKRMSAEQIFLLSVLLAFAQYYGELIEFVKRGERITRELVERTLQSIPGYDVRVAIHRTSANIHWDALESQEMQRLVWEELCIFEDCQGNGCSLSEVFDLIFETKGQDGEYPMTPVNVRKLIVNVMGSGKVHSLGDFCCGGAGLGLALQKELMQRNPEVILYGEEQNQRLCDVAQLQLYSCQGAEGEIIERDVLKIPEISQNQLYDMIVLDVPRGHNVTEPYDYGDPRLQYFNKRAIYPDWIFIQDVLYRLNKTGKAAVLVTNGALIRQNEEILREHIVVDDWLEAVITLPFNLYSKGQAGTELMIFNKNKTQKNRVIFIDISAYYYRAGRNFYAISEEGIELAAKAFWQGCRAKEIRGVSAVCERKQIAENDYSFKPLQYIKHAEEKEFRSNLVLNDVAQIVRGAQTLKKSDMTEEGEIYFINIKDIQNNRIEYGQAERIRRTDSVCKEKFRICQGDILITSKGTAIKAAIVEDFPPEAYISGNVTMIRVDKNKYHPYVLFEYLNSKQGQIALERIQSGTTIRILNNANLQKLKVPEYDFAHMEEIGGKLKKNQEDFYREKRAVEERFEKERERLLEELEAQI